MGFSFLHAADIHLDSPLQNLEQYADAPVDAIRGATRKAFASLVDLALDRKVDFVVLAGDLFDGDWRDYNTGLYFVSQTARLKEEGIRVYLVYGNHDAQSRITKNLSFPDNVHVFPVSEPSTFRIPDLGVSIHGMSYGNRSVSHDPLPLYPKPEPDQFNLGLLHTSVTGRPGHGTYAPCTLEGLIGKGYDYWALGHVHKSEVLCESPFICFSGNPQGRHIRETGPKGCFYVKVTDSGTVDSRFHTLDHVRWYRITLEPDPGGGSPPQMSGLDMVQMVENRLQKVLDNSHNRLCCIRVEISGYGPGLYEMASDPDRWTAEIRSRAFSVGAGRIWVEKILILSTPAKDPVQDPEMDWAAVGEMKSVLEEMAGDSREAPELIQCVSDLAGRLPSDLLKAEDGSDLNDPATLHALLPGVRNLLMGKMNPAKEEP